MAPTLLDRLMALPGELREHVYATYHSPTSSIELQQLRCYLAIGSLLPMLAEAMPELADEVYSVYNRLGDYQPKLTNGCKLTIDLDQFLQFTEMPAESKATQQRERVLARQGMLRATQQQRERVLAYQRKLRFQIDRLLRGLGDEDVAAACELHIRTAALQSDGKRINTFRILRQQSGAFQIESSPVPERSEEKPLHKPAFQTMQPAPKASENNTSVDSESHKSENAVTVSGFLEDLQTFAYCCSPPGRDDFARGAKYWAHEGPTTAQRERMERNLDSWYEWQVDSEEPHRSREGFSIRELEHFLMAACLLMHVYGSSERAKWYRAQLACMARAPLSAT